MKRMGIAKEEMVIVVLVLLTCAAFPAWIWFSARQESQVYNRLTGAQTTAWDALWVELRVQDQPKREAP